MTSFWVLLDAALRGEERSARWLAEKIGVDGSTVARWRFHDLRHTFTTRLHEAGADLRTGMGITGHRDASTHTIYMHADIERMREAIERIGLLA